MAKHDKKKVLEGISSVISLWLELKKKRKKVSFVFVSFVRENISSKGGCQTRQSGHMMSLRWDN